MAKTILMKVTSRERPKQVLETIKSYIDFAENTKDMVWLLSFDGDDASCTAEWFKVAIQETLKDCRGYAEFGISTGKINAVNRDVNEFTETWDILLNISDDQRPIVKGYDNIIRNAMPDDLDASIWYSDGQPRVCTQEILGYNYYKRFSYIYHPAYKSLFCDNESLPVVNCLKPSMALSHFFCSK